jgi:hypothetical protein
METPEREILSIIHIVKDETFDIICVLREENDAKELTQKNHNYSYESWCIEGEDYDFKFNFNYEKKEMYKVGSYVFYLENKDSESPGYGIAKLDWTDKDQNDGFNNVLYHGNHSDGKSVWLMGSEILGEIKDYEKNNFETPF